MRLLFIGNSHTFVNNMPDIVKMNSNEKMEVVMIARPGITFQDHLNDPSYHFMVQQPFDAIILQQAAHSPCPSKEETLETGKKLIEEARKYGQKVYVLAPWAHKGHFDKAIEIKDIYDTLEKDANVEIIRVGEVISHLWDQLDLYYKDDEHMSPLGSYIEACCILAKVANQKHYLSQTIYMDFKTYQSEKIQIDLNTNQLIEKTIEQFVK